MALSGSSPNGSSDSEFEEPSIMAEINITPLTDIFLVLLIIFMVTSSALSQMGVQVDLPQSKSSTNTETKPAVLVTVTKENEILVNGQKVNQNALETEMKSALDQSKDKTIILEGDRKAVLETVVRIMDVGKKLGATKFAVATKGDGG